MDLSTAQQHIQALERENRILTKKLARSETNRQLLENQQEKATTFQRQVIHELRDSQAQLKQYTHTLEATLQELRETQSKLVASEKMSALGTMVAGVAHEINNPINFIHGNLSHLSLYTQDLLHLIQLYQRETATPSADLTIAIEAIDLPFLEQDLKKILRSLWGGTERIRNIVDSLKVFARLDEAEYKAIDLQESLNSTILLIQNRLAATEQRPEIKLVQEYHDLSLVECYGSMMNQVFLQLLNNAIDAIEEKTWPDGDAHETPCIRIAAHGNQAHGYASISISDNGCGIPETVMGKIFDPFFTTKPIGQGSGLGLSTSYQTIVGQHKGHFYCRSVPGRGTEFVIHLPLQQQFSHSSRISPQAEE